MYSLKWMKREFLLSMRMRCLVCLVAFLLSGCVTLQSNLDDARENYKEYINPDVYIIVTQNRIVLREKKHGYGGYGGGGASGIIAGLVLNSIVDAKEDRLQKRLVPAIKTMNRIFTGEKIDLIIDKSFRRALKQSVKYKGSNIIFKKQPLNIESILSEQTKPLVIVTVECYLESGHSRLRVDTNTEVYQDNPGKHKVVDDIVDSFILKHSDPWMKIFSFHDSFKYDLLDEEPPYLDEPQRVMTWVKNDGYILENKLKEGVARNVDSLLLALHEVKREEPMNMYEEE